MKVQLRHHYGWETYEVEADSLFEAAKAAIRVSHDFLEAKYSGGYEMDRNDLGPEYGNCTYVNVIHLPRSEPPPQAAITPAIFRKSAGDPWFSVQYRESPFEAGHVESEIESMRRHMEASP